MKTPWRKPVIDKAPTTEPQLMTFDGPMPAPPVRPKFFNAVSNCDWRGLPVAVGRPPDTQLFRSLEDARTWLREKRCGGSISDGDRIVEEIPPG